MFSLKKSSTIGILFLLVSIVTGCTNDVLARFFVCCITLMPFLNKKSFTDKNFLANLKKNIICGVLGSISMILTVYSIVHIPLVHVTILFWTIPLFEIFLCKIIFNEVIGKSKMWSTFLGFVIVVVMSSHGGYNNTISSFSFNIIYCAPLLGALFFSIQDIIIKNMVTSNKNNIPMLFCFSIVVCICSSIFTVGNWVPLSLTDWLIAIFLGCFGNITQYCVFMSLKYANLSLLAPIRYTEVIFQMLFGIFIFREIPDITTIICALLLIPTVLNAIKK